LCLLIEELPILQSTMSVTTGKQVNLPVITKNADSLLLRFRKQKATKIAGKASEKKSLFENRFK
jgi:hypothetical protein